MGDRLQWDVDGRDWPQPRVEPLRHGGRPALARPGLAGRRRRRRCSCTARARRRIPGAVSRRCSRRTIESSPWTCPGHGFTAARCPPGRHRCRPSRASCRRCSSSCGLEPQTGDRAFRGRRDRGAHGARWSDRATRDRQPQRRAAAAARARRARFFRRSRSCWRPIRSRRDVFAWRAADPGGRATPGRQHGLDARPRRARILRRG